MAFFTISMSAEMFMKPEYWRVSLIYGAIGFLVVFVFQAIALYVIASRGGIKHKWMAFVPILSTYYIGVCARKNKALWLDSKIVGIIIASLELVLCAGYAMHYVGHHFAQDYIVYEAQQDFYGIGLREPTIPEIDSNLAWAGFCYLILDDIVDWVRLGYIFLQVMLLTAFFQTYASRRYILFTIISVIFPIQGILFFVVRNNTGMNYREFVMREQERRYRMYRQYTQNQYDPNNPYNQNNYNQGGGSQNNYGPPPNGYGEYPRPESKVEDPFEEFGNHNDDPFEN